ncbi:MAG: GNAT family N-acetyltransferase [Bacilli bacterium]|nr:GNAT family N-acetyltransferase [Bacilli bacterium]
MEFYLREGKKEDAEQKGFVHFTSWKETYTGLMPEEYLDKLDLETCINIARKYPQNTMVAVVKNIIVGFSGYLEDSRDISSVKPSSEIMAIYILKEYQRKGIGYALIQESLKRVSKKNVILFVLEENIKAIIFYERIGFEFTGHKIIQPVIGGELIELEMVLKR